MPFFIVTAVEISNLINPSKLNMELKYSSICLYSESRVQGDTSHKIFIKKSSPSEYQYFNAFFEY
jgi:hypothetical protein